MIVAYLRVNKEFHWFRFSLYLAVFTTQGGNGIAFIWRIFYMDIFKCVLQHFVGDFAKRSFMAQFTIFLM